MAKDNRSPNSIETNQINYARVLQYLREHGGASRTDITRDTGLSPASVTSITRDLIDRGYVQVGEEVKVSGRGRPPETLIYDAESRYALGIELHDHSVLGVLTNLYAHPLQSFRIAPVEDGLPAVLGAIKSCYQQAIEFMGDKECAAIGIAIPGAVNQENGQIVNSTEFNLTNEMIVDAVQRRIDFPVTAINRTYAAMLAETWRGEARDAKNALYIRLGTYIGGAVLLNGKPHLGTAAIGTASIAHITIDSKDGLLCRCGSRGCLDTVASGDAMARAARSEIKKGQISSLGDRTEGYLERITGTMVAEEAANGDALAISVLGEAARWLGVATGISLNLMGLDTVVLGGKTGTAGGEMLLNMIREAAHPYTYSIMPDTVKYVCSVLGEDAVASGAAATALWATLTQSINLHMS